LPYCYGKDVPDPEFAKKSKCLEFTQPAQELGPHVAALGMRFYTGKTFPSQYHHHIFIAEHGSWNRSNPIGYQITLVKLKKNQPIKYEVFAEGWLHGAKAVMPDGALLVSDDKAGVIYRISYIGEE